MNTVAAKCSECGHEWDVSFDYEGPDDSVGLSGGAYVGDDVECPACGYKLGAKEIHALEEKATEQIETDGDEP